MMMAVLIFVVFWLAMWLLIVGGSDNNDKGQMA